jgi:hypothetical protein
MNKIVTFDGKLSGPRVVRLNHGSFEIAGLRSMSPIFASRAKGEAWLQAKLAKLTDADRPKLRPCICCTHPFESEGKHNRMCGSCRLRASQENAAPFSFGAIHGRKRG